MNSLPQSESKITMANGNRSVRRSTPATIDFDALLRIEQFSVQPITTSVIVNVRANSPISVGPQCATVSASITPGRSGVSSAQVRMLIELRSSADGFVVEMPLIRIRSGPASATGPTVAALIASSSANACSVANGLSKITGLGQQRQPQAEHHHQVLAARHAHQRPHMLQKVPGVVAEAPRPQRAPIDLLGRVQQPRAGQHPPRRRRPIPWWWPRPDPKSCSCPPSMPCRTGCAARWLPAVSRPCRSCLPHRASLPGHALKVGEAPPPATRSNLVRHVELLRTMAETLVQNQDAWLADLVADSLKAAGMEATAADPVLRASAERAFRAEFCAFSGHAESAKSRRSH